MDSICFSSNVKTNLNLILVMLTYSNSDTTKQNTRHIFSDKATTLLHLEIEFDACAQN